MSQPIVKPLTKQEKVLAIIREASKIDCRSLLATYHARHGNTISPGYMYRCLESLRDKDLIVSIGYGQFQLAERRREEVRGNAIHRLHQAMRSRSSPPARIRTVKEIPFVYWDKCGGFGSRGEERVVLMQVGTLGEYEPKTDRYVFKLPGGPVTYRRWTAAHFVGFFEAADES
jgi:hypothetical protein